MTVAFVLSGGASLGASQAGMLQALYEYEIRPDLLVGTSVGAVNAAFIASRPPTLATASQLQRIWRGLSRTDVFPANPITAGLGFLGLRDYSVSACSLRRLVRRHLQFDGLEDAPVDLHVIASDALTGEEVRLSTGSALDAVLASAAVPGVFPPVSWAERRLVDGAVANNTPVSHAIELGADTVIVLQAIGCERLSRVPRGAMAAGITALSRTFARQLAGDLARYAGAADLIFLPAPSLGGVLPTDFGRADDLIADAHGRARSVLARHYRRGAGTRSAATRLPRAA